MMAVAVERRIVLADVGAVAQIHETTAGALVAGGGDDVRERSGRSGEDRIRLAIENHALAVAIDRLHLRLLSDDPYRWQSHAERYFGIHLGQPPEEILRFWKRARTRRSSELARVFFLERLQDVAIALIDGHAAVGADGDRLCGVVDFVIDHGAVDLEPRVHAVRKTASRQRFSRLQTRGSERHGAGCAVHATGDIVASAADRAGLQKPGFDGRLLHGQNSGGDAAFVERRCSRRRVRLIGGPQAEGRGSRKDQCG